MAERDGFAATLVSANAALAGLVLVAVAINIRRILSMAVASHHRSGAFCPGHLNSPGPGRTVANRQHARRGTFAHLGHATLAHA